MSGIARTPGQLSRIGRPLTSLSDANFAPLEEQVVQLASGEDLQARGEIVEGYDSEEATTEELFSKSSDTPITTSSHCQQSYQRRVRLAKPI